MRCKPNQLCRVIYSDWPENVNGIVRTQDLAFLNVWNIETLQPLMTRIGMQPAGYQGVAPDYCLEPLYDGDGIDETLAWKDVPELEEKKEQHAESVGQGS